MSEAREGPFWDMVAGRVALRGTAALLGWKPLEVESGRSRVEFQAKEEFYNPAGVVQGGFLAAMLDDTMGPAAASTVGPLEHVTTVEMKISFIRPAQAGKLIGDGRVVHKGRSIIFAEASLSTEDGSLVATATGTWRVVPAPRQAEGRASSG